MRIIKTKAYKFNELSNEAKQKAIEDTRNSDWYLSFDWWTPVYEEWTEKLEALGYTDIEIMFSGFWSQGDGACFVCKNIDVSQWLRAHKLGNKFRQLLEFDKAVGAKLSIKHNSHYYHESSTSLIDEVYLSDFHYYTDDEAIHKKLELQTNEVIEQIENEMIELGKAIYDDLGNLYEEYQSDESITIEIETNENEFTKDGDLI